MQITIPASIEDAKTSLNGLGALLTAKTWERAAIVYAFTGDSKPGPKVDRLDSHTISFREFAALGIAGLTDKNTVADYRKAWADHGTPGIKPGDSVTLPDMEWPTGLTSRRGTHATTAEIEAGIAAGLDDFIQKNPSTGESIARRVIASKPEIVVEAVKSVPAVVEEIAKDRNLSGEITTRAFQIATNSPRHVTPAIVRDPQKESDDAFWKRVDAAIETVSDGMQADSKGTHGKMPGHVLMGLKMMIIAGLQQYDPDAYKDLQAVLAARTSRN